MTDEIKTEYPKPIWNEDVGKSYIGKYILVGITYLDSDGQETGKQQLHGIIESASEEDGIEIKLKGVNEGESWIMPPDQRVISEANPRTYTLSETGEEIENPDLLSTWIEEDENEENT